MFLARRVFWIGYFIICALAGSAAYLLYKKDRPDEDPKTLAKGLLDKYGMNLLLSILLTPIGIFLVRWIEEKTKKNS